jgi:hypothetical protein
VKEGVNVMTDPLAALKELDAARTPGAWQLSANDYLYEGRWFNRIAHVERDLHDDARWIAACSTALPLLRELAEAVERDHWHNDAGIRVKADGSPSVGDCSICEAYLALKRHRLGGWQAAV